MTLLPSWTVETSLGAMRIMGTTKCPKCKADHDALDALTKALVAFVTAPDPEAWLILIASDRRSLRIRGVAPEDRGRE